MEKLKREKKGYLKSTGKLEFYDMYPYRKNFKTSDNTIPLPYVKKESNHPMSLDYKQWCEIIQLYLSYVMVMLRQGTKWNFAKSLGSLYMIRYDGMNYDRTLFGKKPREECKKQETMSIKLKWFKGGVRNKNAKYFFPRFNRTFISGCYKYYETQLYKYYKLNTK